jgi:hypothetical protein
VKKVHKSTGTDDKKLQTTLKKMNVQPIQAIEEVNMFKSDGNVIHFSAPKGMHTTNQFKAYDVANNIQSMLPCQRTPSPYTATARTRS